LIFVGRRWDVCGRPCFPLVRRLDCLVTGRCCWVGLIEQLSSDAGEGFTHSQAVYGVNKAGL